MHALAIKLNLGVSERVAVYRSNPSRADVSMVSETGLELASLSWDSRRARA